MTTECTCAGPCGLTYPGSEEFTRADSLPWGLDGWCDPCWLARRTTAWTTYRRALREGELVPPNMCERCGEVRPIVGHHTNYLRPLEVQWLCTSCHSRAHRKVKQRDSSGGG